MKPGDCVYWTTFMGELATGVIVEPEDGDEDAKWFLRGRRLVKADGNEYAQWLEIELLRTLPKLELA